MIKVEGLVKTYGAHKVLKGIDFEVKPNEIYGFLGHNGAGKSTTINILNGLIKKDKGNVSVMGTVGFLPEDPKFYPYMTALEYLQFIGSIGGLKKEEIKRRSLELLELVKLSKDARRKVGGYSRGMKQRLGFAVALFNQPQLLLLDEPASALDPEGRKDMMDLIKKLKDEGTTIFLSSHILNDLERISDRIGILNRGQMVMEGSLEDLKRQYLLPVYDIEFEKTSGNLGKRLRNLDWVEMVNEENHLMSITVKNHDEASVELLKLLAENNQAVISYQVRKSSLEDIYMRAVKGNE